MRGLSGTKRSRAGKNGVCGWWQRALGGKEGKVCGEGTSERFCVSLTGFSATPGKFLPVLPRKNLSNTWGKGAPFPSFLGCCLSERLRHFVFRKTGLKITAWSDKIFAVFGELVLLWDRQGNPGNPWSLPFPGGARSEGCTSSWGSQQTHSVLGHHPNLVNEAGKELLNIPRL